MHAKRTGVVTLLSLAVLGVLADPVAAQGYSSITEQLIWDLNWRLLAVAVPITILVEGILFYTVWRFRNNDDPKPTQENRRLEITWTVATAIILLFVGVASYSVLADQNVTATQDSIEQAQDGDAVVVEVTGVQWLWQFNYPAHDISTTNELVLPANRPIVLKLTSNDVIHSFHAPGLGLKQDALPNQQTYLQTTITEPGNYTLYCAEFCGQGHSEMLATIEVMPQDEYDQWVQEQQGGSSGGSSGNNTTTTSSNSSAMTSEPATTSA
ncbi:cytochrome c oxidase subunit II [Halobacteriaceae archaeon GCM10025711]